MENMFEQASRLKLRFESPKGQLTVEDLWSLPLSSGTGAPNLDALAIALHKQLQETETLSFVTSSGKSNKVQELKFEIVKYVIQTKMKENQDKLEAADKAARKAELLDALAEKEKSNLKSLSVDELRKQLAAL